MTELSKVTSGSKGTISKLEGDERFFNRIISMGLTEGCPIEVLRNEKKLPVLIYGRDTMIALNRKECGKIFVETEGEAK
ncbi:MAG: ferrous iron transport protein A [Treponema sp.]|nr:ferrous iron transport protein A [Treponema sp.]